MEHSWHESGSKSKQVDGRFVRLSVGILTDEVLYNINKHRLRDVDQLGIWSLCAVTKDGDANSTREEIIHTTSLLFCQPQVWESSTREDGPIGIAGRNR